VVVQENGYHPLAPHDALAVVLVPALRQMVLQDRSHRLLDLQVERVLLVAAPEQNDQRPQADACDTDDLAGQVELTSSCSCRSGEAKAPKFDMWASPQSWASSPALGVSLRSAAMIVAAPR
jgi:hypothetical protein